MEPATTSSAPRLLDEVRRQIRIRHYAYSTERTYVYWTKFFVRFHRMRHPREMGGAEVEAFLSYLASDRKVSASTQNQAKAALLFLYKAVLGIDLPWLRELVSAQGSRRLGPDSPGGQDAPGSTARHELAHRQPSLRYRHARD